MPDEQPIDDQAAPAPAPAADASADDATNPIQEPLPLGSPNEVTAALANHNIAPEIPNGTLLYGPGLVIEIPTNNTDEVIQILCTMVDEDIAWPVIFRMCQQRDWSLMDPDSGRVLHLSVDAIT